jgi:hypothetical protein
MALLLANQGRTPTPRCGTSPIEPPTPSLPSCCRAPVIAHL